MKTFSPKTKQQIVEVQNGFCAYKDCFEEIHSINHRLKNTKANNNNFPLFVHSPMNGDGLCIYHHANNSHEFVIRPEQAMIYEEYLTILNTKPNKE